MAGMIDGNKSSSLVFIAIIVGLSGLVVSQYFTYSDRLTRFESQLEAANEQLADLNQYRSLEDAEIRYWFAGYSGAPTYRTITVYIKNTGTMNFLITDSFVNGTRKTFWGGSTGLESRWVYAGSGWRRYSVSIRWVESTE